MKKNLFNIYIFSVVLFSDFIMFAQPDDDGDPGDPPVESDDAPPVPINGKLLWLLIVGILFAIYTYRNNKREA
jgi:hypothetical protein